MEQAPPQTSTQTVAKPSQQQQPQPQQPDFGQPLVDSKYHPKNWPFEYTREEFFPIYEQSQKRFLALSRSFRHFSYIPVVHPHTNIKQFTQSVATTPGLDDFFLSSCLHPEFICALMYYGFLPIGDAYPHTSPTSTYQFQWLMPKLHIKRAVMDWSRYHRPTHINKHSNNFFLTINRDFSAVIEGCVGQHGDAWLYPELRQSLIDANKSNPIRHSVQLISVELWMKKEKPATAITETENTETSDGTTATPTTTATVPTPEIGTTNPSNDKALRLKQKFAEKQAKQIAKGFTCTDRKDDDPEHVPSPSLIYGDSYYLVAGELGYSVDATHYCSLTGFRNFWIDGSGSVQLHALASLLRCAGYTIWDFGMMMDYKADLGAVEISKLHFVNYLNKCKESLLLAAQSNKDDDNEKIEKPITDDEKVEKSNDEEQIITDENNNNDITTTATPPATNPNTVTQALPRRELEQLYLELANKQRQEEETLASNQIKTAREKKLRWLIKKHGEESTQVIEYRSQSVQPREGGEYTGTGPRPSYELIPCKNLYKLTSNLVDIEWVNRKPKKLGKAQTATKKSSSTNTTTTTTTTTTTSKTTNDTTESKETTSATE